MEAAKRNKIWLMWGSVSILIVILAVSLGILIYGRIYSATVNVMVAPLVAKVRIGETILAASGEVKIQPGEYDVEITAEGFATKTGKITLISDQIINLNSYLLPNSEETADWYETHEGDAMIMGEIKNNEALKAVTELLEKEPGLNKLPLVVEYYSDKYTKYTKYVLSYDFDESDRGFYLMMKDYTGEGLDVGIRKFNEVGIQTDGIEIRYENLEKDLKNGHAE